jgi:HK97 family phage prohead protease
VTQPQVFIRAFPAALEQSGPHRLSGRFVPFDVATLVLDELPDGGVDIYPEGFRRGAFAPQVSSPEPAVVRRIGLVHTHDGGLGYLGPVIALRDEPDGLWGDVAVLRSKASDVEDLLAAGVKELSVEFRLPRLGQGTVIDGDGVRWRTRAHLDQIALEAKGAYTGARVASFRAELDELAKEEAARHAAETEQAAAVATAAQAEQSKVEAAEQAARQRAELDEWLAAEEAKQAELRARYLSA